MPIKSKDPKPARPFPENGPVTLQEISAFGNWSDATTRRLCAKGVLPPMRRVGPGIVRGDARKVRLAISRILGGEA